MIFIDKDIGINVKVYYSIDIIVNYFNLFNIDVGFGNIILKFFIDREVFRI